MTLAEILSSPLFIAAIFFIIALVYSSVGLGGGSSYTALLAILGFSTLAIPTISLILNLLVTTAGSYNFIRNRHARFNLILPFLVTSMPMAYIGGALQLPKTIFYWVLLVSLIFVAWRIYFWKSIAFKTHYSYCSRIVISLFAGALLGLIAGIAGIGGGIYLVPLILVLGLGTEKEAAASGAIFIWLNSLSGLISRAQYNAIDLTDHIPLFIAVLLGGIMGSYFGAFRLSPRTMDKILGVIILSAIVFLVGKLLQV